MVPAPQPCPSPFTAPAAMEGRRAAAAHRKPILTGCADPEFFSEGVPLARLMPDPEV